jgi:hypothetical protein
MSQRHEPGVVFVHGAGLELARIVSELATV